MITETATMKEDLAEARRTLCQTFGYLELRFEPQEEVPVGHRPIVYTILRHCARSGMSRDISVFVLPYSGTEGVQPRPINITWHVAKILGWRLVNRDGFNAIRCGGAGMDIGFHLVYSLSRKLYGGSGETGYWLKQEWL